MCVMSPANGCPLCRRPRINASSHAWPYGHMSQIIKLFMIQLPHSWKCEITFSKNITSSIMVSRSANSNAHVSAAPLLYAWRSSSSSTKGNLSHMSSATGTISSCTKVNKSSAILETWPDRYIAGERVRASTGCLGSTGIRRQFHGNELLDPCINIDFTLEVVLTTWQS
eukprot:1159929-Pelagomonas_calceolata.AAC.9